jgi:hypothetical protein
MNNTLNSQMLRLLTAAYGTKRGCRNGLLIVGFRGEADMDIKERGFIICTRIRRGGFNAL